MATAVDLSSFDVTCQAGYDTGRSMFVRAAWFFIGQPLLRCAIFPSSGLRARLLRSFGAQIGEGAVLKPGMRVKFPWKLRVGNHCWIGEDCWIDNLAPVVLEDNVCISQGAYLCTGSHDWTDPRFHLITRPIRIHRGAWIAARVSVSPGTVVGEHAIASLGSVISGDIPPYEIYAGNPAAFIKHRDIGFSGRTEPSQERAFTAGAPR